MLAVLYDIHGNLVALEQVLKDAEAAGADAYLLGGDFASWSPWPLETIERLRGLPQTTWIRGNGERWLREPPLDRPDVAAELAAADSGLGTNEGWLRAAYALRGDDGEFEFRRVEYDVERAAQAWERQPGWGPEAAARIRKGSD
jgi:hypothetical protein